MHNDPYCVVHTQAHEPGPDRNDDDAVPNVDVPVGSMVPVQDLVSTSRRAQARLDVVGTGPGWASRGHVRLQRRRAGSVDLIRT
jgi:hypothetical protein